MFKPICYKALGVIKRITILCLLFRSLCRPCARLVNVNCCSGPFMAIAIITMAIEEVK